METFTMANGRAMLSLIREYSYLGYAEPIDWEISACEVEMYGNEPFLREFHGQPYPWLLRTNRLLSRLGLAKEVMVLSLRAHSVKSGSATFSQANGMIEITLGPENPLRLHERFSEKIREQGDFSKHTYW